MTNDTDEKPLPYSKEQINRILRYRNMQKAQYAKGTSDHLEHNENPDLWDCLFDPFSEGDWSNKKILDFGCGLGRNIQNVLDSYDVGEVHGCDISDKNIADCRQRFSAQKDKCFFYVSDGLGIEQDADDQRQVPSEGKSTGYDAVFSTIVMQHIAAPEVRKNIFVSMYERLNSGGLISIQMGYGTDEQYKNIILDCRNDLHMHSLVDQKTGEIMTKVNSYDHRTMAYDSDTLNIFKIEDGDRHEIVNTNGFSDVRVTSPNQLKQTLESIGFVDFDYEIRNAFSDINHPHWIYFKAYKP